jgi:integrase
VAAVSKVRYAIGDREQSILFSKGRLAHVKRLLGTLLLPDVTEDVVRGYIKTRLEEKASDRTINMEVGELSRAIGKLWSVLWPKVRKQEERQDVGKALSSEEEQRLLEATCKKKRWQLGGTIIRIALLTAMRSGEIARLKWDRIDLAKRLITVGKAKSRKGTNRQIPMNDDLFALLSMHHDWFVQKFGEPKPEHFLFPFGKPQPTDPTRCTTSSKTVWGSIRKAAQVSCRLHDLRHTALTKMAEAGVPESTMLALAGHMSRAMLERYSHIRMAAKREAVVALALPRSETKAKAGVPDEVSTNSTTVANSAVIQ